MDDVFHIKPNNSQWLDNVDIANPVNPGGNPYELMAEIDGSYIRTVSGVDEYKYGRYRVLRDPDDPLNYKFLLVSEASHVFRDGKNFGLYYELFKQKNWISGADEAAEISAWNTIFPDGEVGFFTGLTGVKRNILRTILAGWPDGNEGKIMFNTFRGEVNINVNLEALLSASPAVSEAWRGVYNSTLLRNKADLVEDLGKLLNKGIPISKLDEYTVIANQLSGVLSDTDILKIASDIAKSQRRILAAEYFDDLVALQTDVLGQLKKLVSSPNYQNVSDLKDFTGQLRQTTPTNPGFIEQLNEAVKRADLGHNVHLEGSIFKGDIIDETLTEVSQMKSVIAGDVGVDIGTAPNSTFKDNLFKAMKQFTTETPTPPSNYTKIADIRIRNTSHPLINKDGNELKVILEDIYSRASSTYKNLVNNTGFTEIITNSGVFRFSNNGGNYQLMP